MKRMIVHIIKKYRWIRHLLQTHINSFQLYRKAYNAHYFSNLFQHDRMFADSVRVESYFKAIEKHVRAGHRVLDLGTGSGVFAFFAALQHPRKIYAIDHSEIIGTAQTVARFNDLKNITFIRKNSKNLTAYTIPEKVDRIIHDQIGAWLFNENLIDCLLDVRDRFLKPDGKILPGRFRLFIEPVQLKSESRIPFIWEHTMHSISFETLKMLKEKVPPEYFYRRIQPNDVDRFLCQPEPLFQFDLHTLQIGQVPDMLHYHQTVVCDGQLNGFCFYFSVIFDDAIHFSTSPVRSANVYQTWSIPFYRVESVPVHIGDHIEMTLKMADIRNPGTWGWDYRCCRRELI